jgi:hypothetical protein
LSAFKGLGISLQVICRGRARESLILTMAWMGVYM